MVEEAAEDVTVLCRSRRCKILAGADAKRLKMESVRASCLGGSQPEASLFSPEHHLYEHAHYSRLISSIDAAMPTRLNMRIGMSKIINGSVSINSVRFARTLL